MKTKISAFLTERQDRFKPVEANKLGLKRLNKIDFSGNIHLVDKPTNTNMILVKKGDLVISGINIEKGAMAIYQGEEDITATIHYSSYEFDENKIDINYFKWFLKSAIFRKIVQTQIKGGIKTELKPKKFLPLEIDLPDLPTQKKILEKINNLENEVSQLENKSSHDKSLLTSLRQSILQEAVQGKLVPQDPKDEPASELLKKIKAEKEKLIREKKIKKRREILPIEEGEVPYELPGGWEWCRLGDVCELKTGATPSTKNLEYWGGSIKWLASGDVNQGEIFECKGRITEKGMKNSNCKILPKDSVLIALNGQGKTRGTVSLLKTEATCNQSLVAMIPGNKNFLIPDYLYFFLKKNYMAIRNITGHTQRHGLNMKIIANFLLAIPPIVEQKRIVEKVGTLMKLCSDLELKLEENKSGSERLMSAVLKEVFENE